MGFLKKIFGDKKESSDQENKDVGKKEQSEYISEDAGVLSRPLGEYPECPNCGHRYHRSTEDMLKISGPGWLHEVICSGCHGSYYFK